MSSFTEIYILDVVPGIIAASDESGNWTDIDFFYGSCKNFYGRYINYRPVFMVDSRYRTAFLGLLPSDLGSIYQL